MATFTPPSDRAAISARVVAITRDLLAELGNDVAIEAVNGAARLEDDLGLGSIERVELFSRLESVVGAYLPDKAFADARTLGDIVAAIARPEAGGKVETVHQAPPESPSGAEPKTAGNKPALGRDSSAVRARYPVGIETARVKAPLVRRVLEAIYGIYAAAVFFVWLVFTWIIVLLLPPGQTAARATSASLRLYFKLIGCRIRLEGPEQDRKSVV